MAKNMSIRKRVAVGIEQDQSLLATNPYLANPKAVAEMIRQSVITSTAIEGVHIKTKKQKNHKIYT